MDGDDIESHPELVTFLKQAVGIGDPQARVHVGRTLLKNFRLRVPFADTLDKRFQQLCGHARGVLGGAVFAPPVVRNLAFYFAGQRPQFDMRIMLGHGLRRLLQFRQILRRKLPAGVEVVIADQDPRVVEVRQRKVLFIRIDDEEIFDPIAGRSPLLEVQHEAGISIDSVFLISVPDLFFPGTDMVLGADAELPPAVEDIVELPVERGVAEVDAEKLSDLPRGIGLVFDLRIPAEIIRPGAVVQQVIRLHDKEPQSGEVVQRQFQFIQAVRPGPELLAEIQQRLAEEIFDPDPDRPRHFGLGGHDAEPAVDLVFRGEEVVRCGGDQSAFRGRGLIRGGLFALFQLDGIQPDCPGGLSPGKAGMETEISQRSAGFYLKIEFIPFPAFGIDFETPYP